MNMAWLHKFIWLSKGKNNMLKTSWGSNKTSLIIMENNKIVKIMRVSLATKYKQINRLILKGYTKVSSDRIETIFNK